MFQPFQMPRPLADITNLHAAHSNKNHHDTKAVPFHLHPHHLGEFTFPDSFSSASFGSPITPFAPGISPEAQSMSMTATVTTPTAPTTIVRKWQHEPYNWKCVPSESQMGLVIAQRLHQQIQRALLRRASHCPLPEIIQPPTPTAAVAAVLPTTKMTSTPLPEAATALAVAAAGCESDNDERDVTPRAPRQPAICRCLVQFKCHQAEYSSPLIVEKGQYVVVQGDRGIDIGVVIRTNTEETKSYVERTGPSGSVMRFATQREVDYWASELKSDEQTALDFCRSRVVRHQLQMEIRHAEYQFDKKKLTFYYEAHSRVDFVCLLKELYREYGCRIWMEKLRQHD